MGAVGIVAVLLLALSVAASARAETLAFVPCRPGQLPTVHSPAFQCASLRVPLDRTAPQIGSVTVAVQRIPASAPRQGTIVFLAGGPGQAAIPAYDPYLLALAKEDTALRAFELVTFDQRGTGQSGQLQCPKHPRARTAKGLLGECAKTLGPALSDYTSQDSADDIESLREALGGGKISLVAVSYGGRVAGLYAHEHAEDIAHLVLDSPSTMTGPEPINTPWLHALPRVLDEGICGGGACSGFTANLYGDLTRLLARLRGHPAEAEFVDQRGHLTETFIGELELLGLLAGTDVDPGLRRVAPADIAAAAHGHLTPLARLLEEEPAPGTPGDTSGLLFLATSCSEDSFPWSAESPPDTRRAILERYLKSVPPATTAPFTVPAASALSPLLACSFWPSTRPAPPPPAGTSPAPTLILSGVDDLRTPYEQSLRVATGYSDVHVLQIPATGHSTISTSRCAIDAMSNFLASGQAPGPCPPPSEPQVLPLPPSTLAKVRPASSSSHLAGRVAEAAAMTLDDILSQPGGAGGGLEAGRWAVRGDHVRLRRTVDVAGVALSGSIVLGGTPRGRITVAGRLHGTLELNGQTLAGRLGRARARARVLEQP